MAHRWHTGDQHEEDDTDRQKDVHNLPAAPCSSHPKHLWEDNGNEQCVVLAHHGGNCASPAESELATSPLLLPTGLLPPVRCLKSIPRALQSCQTALSQNTLSIHVLLHSPCAAGPFPADPLVPLKQQRVQLGRKSSWGAGGAEVPHKGQKCRDVPQQLSQARGSPRSCAAALLENLRQSASAHVQVITERNKDQFCHRCIFFFLTSQVATLLFCQFTKLD